MGRIDRADRCDTWSQEHKHLIFTIMKRTERISIANCPFIIDLDAHTLLTQYLDSLTRKFGAAKENELVQDIECRIAEILNESIKDKNQVVDIEMTRMVIVQIGTVSSIELDSLDTESGVRFSFPNAPKSDENSGSQIVKEGLGLIERLFSGIGRFFIYLIMICLAGGFIGCVIGSTIALAVIGDAFEMIYDINFFERAVIPITVGFFLLSLMGLIYRIIDRGRHFISKWVFILITGLIGIAGASFAIYFIAYEIKAEYAFSKVDRHVEYIEIGDNQKFIVEIDSKDESIRQKHNILRIKNDENVLVSTDVDLHRDNSLKNIKVVVKRKAYGATSSEALSRAKRIDIPIEIDSNIIRVNNRIKVLPPDWVRGLDVDVDIYYPDHLVTVKRERINNY